MKGDNQESLKELENVTDGFSMSAIKVTINFFQKYFKETPQNTAVLDDILHHLKSDFGLSSLFGNK